MFKLHPQLQKDSIFVCDLTLCRVLLANDCQYPWLILVPMRNDIKEVIDLTEDEQQLLWQESAKVSRMMRDCYHPDKLNIASLGNMVPQLHVHHVARFTADPAWPGPVWGAHAAINYPSGQLDQIIADIKEQLL
jgi:diadenosine tetraphosphate (Ap4A) HIT family hydrolase